MIDLHLHTNASDGRLTPSELVARASAAGLTTISVTDHDTVAAIAAASASAAAAGIRVVPGIEITAIDDGRDVHVLGYFFDPANAALGTFLEGQRARRVSRVREIGERLRTLGMPVDVDAVLASAGGRPGSSVGRPQVARALVQAGHVRSVQDAFDRWLATGQPGYVPRRGPSPAGVIEAIHQAGGLASFAHPGVTKRDHLITPLVACGLDAIEVYHSDHASEDERTYAALAARLGVLVSGGSDFHGDEPAPEPGPSPSLRAGRRRATLGAVLLPAAAFQRLEDKARRTEATP